MIQAHALVCDERQRVTLAPVRLRPPAPDQLLIRTQYTGVSVGTEFALIRNKISWGPYPLCTGYQGSGIVEAAGEETVGFKKGDPVFFRANDHIELDTGQPVSCVQGAHCSHVVTRPSTDYGVDHVPPGAPMEQAAMFVMPAVGLAGVDMVNPRMGQTVVVHGVGLIGLGVVAACAHRGCRVIAVDLSDLQLGIARKLGADHTINSSAGDLATQVKQFAPGGADVVFEATGVPACVDPAISLCKPEGSFVWQGNYGAAPIAMHFLPAHGRRLRMFFPCDDGLAPCRRAVVKNFASGALPWQHCITHRIPAAQAPDLYHRINANNARDVVGAVIQW